MFCKFCGTPYDDHSSTHEISTRHICNKILAEYKETKRGLSGNRHGIVIHGKAGVITSNGTFNEVQGYTKDYKIRINVKPNEEVKFVFRIRNEMTKEDIGIVGFQLGHPQPEFVMSEHPYKCGQGLHVLEKKSAVKEEISVRFRAVEVGQHEMPIMFTFNKKEIKKDLVICREMVVMIEEHNLPSKYPKTPYSKDELPKASQFVPAKKRHNRDQYPVPKNLKLLFAKGLEMKSLETEDEERRSLLTHVLVETSKIINDGITLENYVPFFHHLLWWEEVKARINLRKYNMKAVSLEHRKAELVLAVPGLAEKRPSLLRGDRVFLQPVIREEFIFECVIKNIEDNCIILADFDRSFYDQHRLEAKYNVRFIMSRVPRERAHRALDLVLPAGHAARLFPDKDELVMKTAHSLRQPVAIYKFWNELVRKNDEQRAAVQHIVAGSSGRAPYIVFGPPGTGKTMTIVEAIIQLVVQNKDNRILVCTDSNMAADHVALMLIKYNAALNMKNFLFRISSQTREWSTLPAELKHVSNGVDYDSFYRVENADAAQYRILVTTLLHSATYSSERNQQKYKLEVSHLFVDEAAQASEPHTLVPLAGLLARGGRLVLAGDPRQLGPVVMSREAGKRGLGQSLLERLKLTCPLYRDNPNFITMLRQNFRTDPDILQLPNKLFYNNELVPMAPADPLSRVSVLGLPGGQRAAVFHALHSKEQRMGNAPSFFNDKELEMLKRYVGALVVRHGVSPKDIGVIAPYIRQVYKMKSWLLSQKYDIEVGTVEAFQGKEKRVILVSTVRANCGLLDYDAKYGLGFLVDDKRFNVAMTRAKAKLIIIGNPTCLTRDEKWLQYMNLCRDFGCYHGVENQQLERTEDLLLEVAKTRFDKCRITDVLEQKRKEKEMEKLKQEKR